jgi:hypothetical protein
MGAGGEAIACEAQPDLVCGLFIADGVVLPRASTLAPSRSLRRLRFWYGV